MTDPKGRSNTFVNDFSVHHKNALNKFSTKGTTKLNYAKGKG